MCLVGRYILLGCNSGIFACSSGSDDVEACGCCWQQILSQMEAVADKKAPRQPRFVQPLQNAEITEGQR